jgi:hypothetical protein
MSRAQQLLANVAALKKSTAHGGIAPAWWMEARECWARNGWIVPLPQGRGVPFALWAHPGDPNLLDVVHVRLRTPLITVSHPYMAEKTLEVALDLGDIPNAKSTQDSRWKKWLDTFTRRVNRIYRTVGCSHTSCGAGPNKSCTRPSEHMAWMQAPHQARRKAMDKWLTAIMRTHAVDWSRRTPAVAGQEGVEVWPIDMHLWLDARKKAPPLPSPGAWVDEEKNRARYVEGPRSAAELLRRVQELKKRKKP